MQLNLLYHLISAWRFLLHPTSIPFILGRLGRKRSSTATTVGSSLGRRLPRQHLSPSSLVSPGPLEVNTQLGFFKEDGKCFPSMATQLVLDLQVLKGGFDVYKLIKFIFSTEGCPFVQCPLKVDINQSTADGFHTKSIIAEIRIQPII